MHLSPTSFISVARNTVYNITPASFSFCICHQEQQQDRNLNDDSF